MTPILQILRHSGFCLNITIRSHSLNHQLLHWEYQFWTVLFPITFMHFGVQLWKKRDCVITPASQIHFLPITPAQLLERTQR